jgi:hypothetical protein
MAYVNPYANTMNYEPSTLWEHPEPYKTDWSTFWGTPGEDDDNGDENGDENGYNPEGPESQAKKGADSELQSLWGDIVKDFETEAAFKHLYSDQGTKTGEKTFLTSMINQANPTRIWASPERRQQYGYDTSGMRTLAPGETTQGWTNPLGNTQTQNADATLSALANAPNVTATALTDQSTQAYQPSYNQQQQATNAYSPSYATQADAYAEYPELSGNLGLLQDTSQISLADQLTNNQAAIDQNALQRITLAEELANNQAAIDRNARELGIFDTMQDVYSDPDLSEEDILW